LTLLVKYHFKITQQCKKGIIKNTEYLTELNYTSAKVDYFNTRSSAAVADEWNNSSKISVIYETKKTAHTDK